MTDGAASVDDVLEEIGFGRFQVYLLLGCGLNAAMVFMMDTSIAVILPAVQFEWDLSSTQVFLIPLLYYVAYVVGSPVFGGLADTYGRWPIFLLSGISLAFYLGLSAISQTLPWLLLLMFLAGLSAPGTLTSSQTLNSELLPRSSRRSAVTLCNTITGLVNLFQVGLALFVFQLLQLNWRWLIFCDFLVVGLSLLCLLWLPESPRYHLLAGDEVQALKILNRVAQTNGRPPFQGRLTRPPVGATQDEILRELIHPYYALTLAAVCFTWFVNFASFLASINLMINLPSTSYACLQNRSAVSTVWAALDTDTSCGVIRPNLAVYLGLLMGGVSEVISYSVGVLLAWYSVPCRWGMVLCASFSIIGYVLLDLCVPQLAKTFLICLVRFFSCIWYTLLDLYTVEIFPTSIRSVSLALSLSSGRIGMIVGTFVARNMVMEISVLASLLLLATLCALSILLIIFLPQDKMKEALRESTRDASPKEPSSDWLSVKQAQDYSTFK